MIEFDHPLRLHYADPAFVGDSIWT